MRDLTKNRVYPAFGKRKMQLVFKYQNLDNNKKKKSIVEWSNFSLRNEYITVVECISIGNYDHMNLIFKIIIMHNNLLLIYNSTK